MSLDLLVTEKFREVVREEIRAALRENNPSGVEKPATYEQAAKFAECCVSTIQAWVKRGVLPATGKGKLRRVLLSDVSKALAGLMDSAPTPPSKKSRAEEILATVRRIR